MICGIDEAGRGPIAGPVYASAVVFKDDFFDDSSNCILNDSKKMSAKNREKAFEKIIEHSFYAIAFATHTEIDELNILQATFLAMKRAFSTVYNIISNEKPKLLRELSIIVDGNSLPKFNENVLCNALVKADSKIMEVMAASILAKVSRDKKMVEYSHLYPQWNYEKHKGYPTKAHKEAIRKHGMSPIQRQTFKF